VFVCLLAVFVGRFAVESNTAAELNKPGTLCMTSKSLSRFEQIEWGVGGVVAA
jgi:hypothetical protein